MGYTYGDERSTRYSREDTSRYSQEDERDTRYSRNDSARYTIEDERGPSKDTRYSHKDTDRYSHEDERDSSQDIRYSHNDTARNTSLNDTEYSDYEDKVIDSFRIQHSFQSPRNLVNPVDWRSQASGSRWDLNARVGDDPSTSNTISSNFSRGY